MIVSETNIPVSSKAYRDMVKYYSKTLNRFQKLARVKTIVIALADIVVEHVSAHLLYSNKCL